MDHFFGQLWLVLGVKLMEINSNLLSRQLKHPFINGCLGVPGISMFSIKSPHPWQQLCQANLHPIQPIRDPWTINDDDGGAFGVLERRFFLVEQ